MLADLAFAADIELDPASDIVALTSALSPGSVIVFKDGTYTISKTLTWSGVGTADQPITIKAASGAKPVIQLADGNPIVRIQDSAFLSVEGLVFEGTPARIEAGGFDGLRVESSTNLTIKNNVFRNIRNTGVYFGGNNADITFEHNEITALTEGSGLVLGCWDASCWTQDSYFLNNWIHGLTGENATAIWMGPGTQNTQVNHNVVHTTLNRGIYVGSTEYGERNIIEGNAIWGVADTGIYIEGSSSVRNNLVFQVDGRGIRADGGDRVFEKVAVTNNTVASTTGWGIEIYDWAGKEGMVLANNAITNPTGYGLRTQDGHIDAGNYLSTNVVTGLVEGFAEFPTVVVPGSGIADYDDIAAFDFYPGNNSALVDAGDPSGSAYLPEADFNGSKRDGEEPDVGAYELITNSNPGWVVQEGFKDVEAATAPPIDVGGCGCKGKGADTDAAAAGLLLPLLGWALRRRRRASAQ